MKALIDADILRYEIGFGAERGIKDLVQGGKDMDILPSMTYIEELLTRRVYQILEATKCDDFELYLSSSDNRREEFATIKPYKGQREEKKPHQFEGMTDLITSSLPHNLSKDGLEADDMMAIEQVAALKAITEDGCKPEEVHARSTIIVSRDKDLRQVPGWHYGWGCGRQEEYPVQYHDGLSIGSLDYNAEKNKLGGTGLLFFYAQLLMGDSTDNIGGVPKIGPKKAYELLSYAPEGYLKKVAAAYQQAYGSDWHACLWENGKLLWLVRRYTEGALGMEPEWYVPGEMREEKYHGQVL